MADFAATIDAWATETADRMERIWKEAAQRVTSIAVNGVPVDTGFARASVRVSTEAMPAIDPNAKGVEGQTYTLDLGSISGAISGAKLGGTIYTGFTANYAIFLEFGHSKQAPQGFVRLAAAQWQTVVSEVVAEAKALA